jgi:hypothetical protein
MTLFFRSLIIARDELMSNIHIRYQFYNMKDIQEVKELLPVQWMIFHQKELAIEKGTV